MVKLNNLSPAEGATHPRKRVGLGNGSGHGNYAGRGRNGQKSRSGNNKMRPGFEGGQLPLIKRLPQKRGFTNHFRIEYSPVNLSSLNDFESGSEVTPEKLFEVGLVKSLKNPVKILGDGELSHPLTIKANKFSATAKLKIEAAGGKAEEVGHAAKAK
ncbi:MAG: 50S ribosomal protein L15 [Dehalococcoidales bacterium]|nr:50S ribosomal protein L15 [Dehalococcoidales bacterium]